MKNFLLCLILPLVVSVTALNAAPVDSVGVVSVGGKQVVQHKVEAGDTWFSISRKYGVPYAELRLANKGAAESLKVGQLVNVPSKLKPTDPANQKNYSEQTPVAPAPAVKPTPAPEPAKPAAAPAAGGTQHKVAPGETVYRISKMYNVKPADLCAWNNIKNNSIEPGQVLIIKGGAAATPAPVVAPVVTEKPKPAPVAPVAPAVVPVKEPVKTPKVEITEAEPVNAKPAPTDFSFAKNRKEIQETGDADRIFDEPVNPNKYYALHASAPIGTIIMVRNLSNDRSVFVKVVGRLEENESNRGLIIKLSRAGAEQLKAPNKRFKVELLYGMGVPKVR